MLSPLSSTSSLHSLSPLRSARPPLEQDASGESVQDVYAPTTASAAEKPSAAAPESLLNKAVLGTCLAVGAVGGVLAMVPTAAAAQVQTARARHVKDPVLRQLLASSLVTGRIPPGSTPERVAMLKPAVREELEGLPPEVQECYVELDAPARKWLASQIDGSSPTPLGNVEHRKAFIKGRVVVFNIFDMIKEKIDDQVKDGKIPREAQPRIHDFLEELKDMRPNQREALANALTAEWKPVA
jgi:hypothetical protein